MAQCINASGSYAEYVFSAAVGAALSSANVEKAFTCIFLFRAIGDLTTGGGPIIEIRNATTLMTNFEQNGIYLGTRAHGSSAEAFGYVDITNHPDPVPGEWCLAAFGYDGSFLCRSYFRSQSISSFYGFANSSAAAIGNVITPDRLRIYGLDGAIGYQCVAIHNLLLAQADLDAMFVSKRPNAAIMGVTSGFTTANVIWACCFGTMPAAAALSGTSGVPIDNPTTGDLVYDTGLSAGGFVADMVARGVTYSSPTASTFFSPYDGPWNTGTGSSPFWVPGTFAAGTAISPTATAGSGQPMYNFVNGVFSSARMRVGVWGNSRCCLIGDSGHIGLDHFGPHFLGGLEAYFGTNINGCALVPPVHITNGNPHFDMAVNPALISASGTVAVQNTLAGSTAMASLGNYCADHTYGWTVLNPSQSIRFLQKSYGMVIDAAPLRQQLLYLNWPNGGTFQLRTERDIAQSPRSAHAVVGSYGSVINTTTSIAYSRVLNSIEATSYATTGVTPFFYGNATITLVGNNLGITTGMMCCKGLDVAHVKSAVNSGANTLVTLDNQFSVAPANGNTLNFGPWSWGTLQVDHVACPDKANWRGFQILAGAGASGIALFGLRGWNPNANGVAFQSFGTGGFGFTPELGLFNSSGAGNLSPLNNWLQNIHNCDVNVITEGLQGTDSSVIWPQLQLVIKGQNPTTQNIWISDPYWGHVALTANYGDSATSPASAPYMRAVATAANEPFATAQFYMTATNTFDTEDLMADGQFHDGPLHRSQRGNLKVWQYLIPVLKANITAPTTVAQVSVIVPGALCSQSDLEDKFGIDNIAQWSNLDNTSSGANSARITKAILYALNEIVNYFANSNLTLASLLAAQTAGNGSITDWATTIAGVWLYNNRGIVSDNSGKDSTKFDQMQRETYFDMGLYRAGVKTISSTRAANLPSGPVSVNTG